MCGCARGKGGKGKTESGIISFLKKMVSVAQ